MRGEVRGTTLQLRTQAAVDYAGRAVGRGVDGGCQGSPVGRYPDVCQVWGMTPDKVRKAFMRIYFFV